MTIERALKERVGVWAVLWFAVFACSAIAYIVMAIGHSFWSWNADLKISLPTLAVAFVSLILAAGEIAKHKDVSPKPEPGDDPARWAGPGQKQGARSQTFYLFACGGQFLMAVVYLGMGLDTLLRHLDGKPTLNIMLGLGWLVVLATTVRRYRKDYRREDHANA